MMRNFHGEYLGWKRYRIECHRCGWYRIVEQKWYAEYLYDKHKCTAREIVNPSPGTIAAQIQADKKARDQRIKESRKHASNEPPF